MPTYPIIPEEELCKPHDPRGTRIKPLRSTGFERSGDKSTIHGLPPGSPAQNGKDCPEILLKGRAFGSVWTVRRAAGLRPVLASRPGFERET